MNFYEKRYSNLSLPQQKNAILTKKIIIHEDLTAQIAQSAFDETSNLEIEKSLMQPLLGRVEAVGYLDEAQEYGVVYFP